jgi:exopolysaccharide production protein ExoY
MVRNGDEILRRHLAENPRAANEWATKRKLRNDPRVTRLGSLLRKSSIDELPQLFNVLKGDMSCIGPRPIVPDELDHYGNFAIYYLSARPGITGLWQTSGRSTLSYAKRVELDVQYVKGWSLAMDSRILLRTVVVLLRRGEAM